MYICICVCIYIYIYIYILYTGERSEGQVCREVYLSKEVVKEEKDASEAACVGAVQGVERRWVQYVSSTPATRLDVINLQEELDRKLREGEPLFGAYSITGGPRTITLARDYTCTHTH